MNDATKQLAEKVAHGKGLNAEDRALLAEIAKNPKELTAYADHMIATGKKVEKLTVEMLDGQGRFGRYMKVNVPGSYKSLNMGKSKFIKFFEVINTIGYENIVKAFDSKELHEPWTFDVESK